MRQPIRGREDRGPHRGLDADGEFTPLALVRALRIIPDEKPASAAKKIRGDLDGEGKIRVSDLVRLRNNRLKLFLHSMARPD